MLLAEFVCGVVALLVVAREVSIGRWLVACDRATSAPHPKILAWVDTGINTASCSCRACYTSGLNPANLLHAQFKPLAKALSTITQQSRRSTRHYVMLPRPSMIPATDDPADISDSSSSDDSDDEDHKKDP